MYYEPLKHAKKHSTKKSIPIQLLNERLKGYYFVVFGSFRFHTVHLYFYLLFSIGLLIRCFRLSVRCLFIYEIRYASPLHVFSYSQIFVYCNPNP